MHAIIHTIAHIVSVSVSLSVHVLVQFQFCLSFSMSLIEEVESVVPSSIPTRYIFELGDSPVWECLFVCCFSLSMSLYSWWLCGVLRAGMRKCARAFISPTVLSSLFAVVLLYFAHLMPKLAHSIKNVISWKNVQGETGKAKERMAGGCPKTI